MIASRIRRRASNDKALSRPRSGARHRRCLRSSILRSACTWFPMAFVFSLRGPSSVLPLAGAPNHCAFGVRPHVTKTGLDALDSGSPVKGGALTLAPGASRLWALRRSGDRNAAQERLRTRQGADEAIDRCRSGAAARKARFRAAALRPVVARIGFGMLNG